MPRKVLAFGSIVLCFVVLCAFEDPVPSGQDIYKKKCQRCHGEVGTKGAFGAKNLQQSRMKYDDVVALIMNGKRPMPGFQSKLTKAEIGLVADFTVKLRK